MSMTLPELQRFAAELAATPELWAHHVRHGCEERVYEQILSENDLNAWVICWSEDHDTGFHDHDDSAAGIAVVSGTVREERLRIGSVPRGRDFGPGASFTVPPVAIHRVLHAGDGTAVTIHVYSPPLARTGAYRVGDDGALEREALPYETELRAEPALP
jgi:mannose-6-phosphate isomerase-like protein (cupin superfamily)